jgi:ABC-type multidrug transport system fused ATPase/permease subunit
VIAYDYPLLGIFWTTLVIFLWIAWFMLLFRVIFDIFRSDDLGGWGKALWLIFVIFLPFLGVLVYVIARGHRMGERDMAEARAKEQAFQEYVRQTAGTAGTGGTAEELTKLASLKDQGVITEAEFQQQKAKLLSS